MRPYPLWHVALKAPGATAAAVRLRFPPLAKVPLIFASPGAYSRVVCASRDALEHTVRAGMPVIRARRLCGRATVIDYSPTAVSAPLRLLEKTFACCMSPVEPDQFAAVADASMAVDRLVEQMTAYCNDVLDVTCSIKAASSLLWARVGLECGRGCPDIIPQGQEAALLSVTPLSKLPWLPARGIATFGHQWSVFTLGDLAAAPASLTERLLGREALELSGLGQRKRSMNVEPVEERILLSPATNSHRMVRGAVLRGVDCVWSRLRQVASAVARIELVFNGSDGRIARRSTILLPEPEDPVNLGSAAIDLLSHLAMRHAVRAVVVRAWPGCPRGRQLSLFPVFSSAKSERLGNALTKLTTRYGSGIVTRAAMLLPSAA